VYALKLK